MPKEVFVVRQALAHEYGRVGALMVEVYSHVEGFPDKEKQPEYYEMLANIGKHVSKPNTELLVAVNDNNQIAGAVVYFSDMKEYGSGGSATKEINASGFRLLAVDPKFRGRGIGKLISKICIEKAIKHRNSQLIIHSTEFMKTAWKMYIDMGFKRSSDLDFTQNELSVFGFRLHL